MASSKHDKWINRYPTPPTKGGKLRTSKPKNRGVAPCTRGKGCASDGVKKRDVRPFVKNGPAMKQFFKRGCK